MGGEKRKGRLMSRRQLELERVQEALSYFLRPLVLGDMQTFETRSFDVDSIRAALLNDALIDRFIETITTYVAKQDSVDINEDVLTLLFTDFQSKGFMAAMRKRTKLLGNEALEYLITKSNESEVFQTNITATELSTVASGYYSAIIRYLSRLVASRTGMLADLESVVEQSTRTLTLETSSDKDDIVPSENELLVQDTIEWIAQNNTMVNIMDYVQFVETFFIAVAHLERQLIANLKRKVLKIESQDDILGLAESLKDRLMTALQLGVRIQDVVIFSLEKQRFAVDAKSEYNEETFDLLFNEQSTFIEKLIATKVNLETLIGNVETELEYTCKLYRPSPARLTRTISAAADTLEYILNGGEDSTSDIKMFLHLYNNEEDLTNTAIGLTNATAIERIPSMAQHIMARFLSQNQKWTDQDPALTNTMRQEISQFIVCLERLGKQASGVFGLITVRRNALEADTPSVFSGVSSPVRPQSSIDVSHYGDEDDDEEEYNSDDDTKSDIGYLHTQYTGGLAPNQITRLQTARLHSYFSRVVTAAIACRQTRKAMHDEDVEEEDAPIEELDEEDIDDTILGEEYIAACDALALIILFFAYYGDTVNTARAKYRHLEWRAIIQRCLGVSTLVFLDDQGLIDEVKVRGLQYAQKLDGVIAVMVGVNEKVALPVNNPSAFYTCLLNYVRLFVDLVADLQIDFPQGDKEIKSNIANNTYTKYATLFTQLYRQVYRTIIVADGNLVEDAPTLLDTLLIGDVRRSKKDTQSVYSSDLTSLSEMDSIFSSGIDQDEGSDAKSDNSDDSLAEDIVTPVVVGAKRKRPATQLNASFKVKFFGGQGNRPLSNINIYDWQRDIQRTMTWKTTPYAKERRPSTFLYCDAGTGKTITTILCLEELARLVLIPHNARNMSRGGSKKKKTIKPLLTIVIVANETAQQSWRAEFYKVASYLKALKDARIDINLMTYDKFENLNTSRFKPCVIVIDEVHHYRTRSEAASPTLDDTRVNVINKCASADQVLLLSATPIEYGLEDFAIYYLMLLGIPYEENIYKRVFDYFEQISTNVLKGNQTFSSLSKQFHACLKCRLVRVKKVQDDRFVKYNDPIRDRMEVGLVRLTLDSEADHKYQLAKELDSQDGNHGFMPKSRAALNVESHKADAIVQILRNHKAERQRRGVPMKVIVYSFFLESGGQLVYNKVKNLTEWNTKFLKERLDKEAVNTFNAFTSELEVIIISSKTSEGLNLKNVSLLVIMEPPFTLDRYDQIIGRVARNGGHADTPDDLLTAKVIMFTENRATGSNSDLTISDRIIHNLKKRLVLQEWFSETAVGISTTTLNDRRCMKNRPSVCAPTLEKK